MSCQPQPFVQSFDQPITLFASHNGFLSIQVEIKSYAGLFPTSRARYAMPCAAALRKSSALSYEGLSGKSLLVL